MVVAWLGQYFVRATRYLAAHYCLGPGMPCPSHGTIYQLHWSYTEPYMESFTLSYIMRFARCIVVNYLEVMRIDHIDYEVSYPSH